MSEIKDSTAGGVDIVERHFVHFLSPGTFFHEETGREIDSWDVDAACEMARSIVERYNATPFAFYFTTRSRGPEDLDSHETARSNRYFLGGKVETLAEVEARGAEDERILLQNMRCNGWGRIVVNTNSWKVTQPMMDGDVILPWSPPETAVTEAAS